MSRELLEAVADPLFNGWEAMKANDEVGDRCEDTAQNFAANWGGQPCSISGRTARPPASTGCSPVRDAVIEACR